MIKTFSTGRQYSSQGQRIAYRLATISADADVPGMDWAAVEFVDIDRGISGVLTVLLMNGETLTNRHVLAAYDAGGYAWLPFAAQDELTAIFASN